MAPMPAPSALAPPNGSRNMRAALDDAERQQMKLATLEQANWIVAGPNGAAARLGMKRSTLQSRMQKLGIRISRTERVKAPIQIVFLITCRNSGSKPGLRHRHLTITPWQEKHRRAFAHQRCYFAAIASFGAPHAPSILKGPSEHVTDQLRAIRHRAALDAVRTTGGALNLAELEARVGSTDVQSQTVRGTGSWI